MRIECSGLICMESFKVMPQLGRFTLRDESKCTTSIRFSVCTFSINFLVCIFPDKTIAIGKVLKVLE